MKRLLEFLRWLCLRRFKNVWLFALCGSCAALCVLASCCARLSWRLDLLVNGIPQYALALSVCVAALLLYRRWLWALCLVPFLALCLCFIVPLYLPGEAASLQVPEGARTFKLLSFNVFSGNGRIEEILRFIETENPDFIVLTEYTDKWESAAQRLSKVWKTRVLEPHTDNFGIALFSRHEGTSTLSRTDDEFGLPTHFMDFELPEGRRLRLVGVHSMVPLNGLLHKERSECLLQAARLCREASERGGASLLAGDLNVTPFSPAFRDLLKAGKLESASQGRGLLFTWPSWSYFPLKPLSMQLDHCLVSGGVKVARWRLGPDLGSDHYPVVVDFALK